jgi:hypothetical protein
MERHYRVNILGRPTRTVSTDVRLTSVTYRIDEARDRCQNLFRVLLAEPILQITSLSKRYWEAQVDSLLAELRRTNALLLLAHGPQISRTVRALTATPAARSVIGVLMEAPDDEMATAALLAATRSRGVGRSRAYEVLTELEAGGLVERTHRGFVGLTSAARSFLPVHRSSEAVDESTSSVS